MLINKEKLPLVAMEFMNDVHIEDVDIINDLYELVLIYENEPTSDNELALNKKYSEWFEHTVEHFRGEEVMMKEKNFPPFPMHKGEHDSALMRMDEVFRSWQNSKDIAILKAYISDELPDWLNAHILSMDTVTAMFFKSGLSPCSMR